MASLLADTHRQLKGYKAFIPVPVNIFSPWSNDDIAKAYGEAECELAKLEQFSFLLKNSSDDYAGMFLMQEAVASTRIENIPAKVMDVLVPAESLPPERRKTRAEAEHYIQAMKWSYVEQDRSPVSACLIKGAHRILLQDNRHLNPGEVRMSQNWIGGRSPQTARFVPPPFADIPDLLTDLERYWHNKALSMPPLIRTGVSHAQFETIHPFLDGNGRTGRMLILMLLRHYGLLTLPILPLSSFLLENRREYFDALEAFRTEEGRNRWLLFFLRGITESARSARETIEHINELYRDYNSRIIAAFGRNAPKARDLLHHLLSHPVVQVLDVQRALNITKPSANTLVAKFADLGLLRELTGQKKNRMFSLWEYVSLFDSSPQ